MKAEFSIDENHSVWFKHASDIFVRPNSLAKKAEEEQ